MRGEGLHWNTFLTRISGLIQFLKSILGRGCFLISILPRVISLRRIELNREQICSSALHYPTSASFRFLILLSPETYQVTENAAYPEHIDSSRPDDPLPLLPVIWPLLNAGA